MPQLTKPKTVLLQIKEDQTSDDPPPTKTKKVCRRQKNGKENVTTPDEARDSLPTKKIETSDDPLPSKKVCQRQKSGKEHLVPVSDISMTIECVVCMLIMCCYM